MLYTMIDIAHIQQRAEEYNIFFTKILFQISSVAIQEFLTKIYLENQQEHLDLYIY